MKSLALSRVALLGIAAVWFTACKKSDDAVTPATTNTGNSATSSVAGYWFGSAYGGAFNQSFLLKANGTVKVYDFYYYPTSTDTTKAYDGTGTYTVSGSAIVIKTTFPNGQSFTGNATLALTASPKTMTFDNSSNGYSNDVYKKQ